MSITIEFVNAQIVELTAQINLEMKGYNPLEGALVDRKRLIRRVEMARGELSLWEEVEGVHNPGGDVSVAKAVDIVAEGTVRKILLSLTAPVDEFIELEHLAFTSWLGKLNRRNVHPKVSL